MDGKTLMASMTYDGYPAPLPLSRYVALAPAINTALIQAKCTTVERVAMFLAQVGAESGSLRWMNELADGTAYDRYLNPRGPWRTLGNTQAGDGARFKGHGPLQITGRHNHTELSRWAFQQKIPGVTSPTFFVDHPEKLGTDRFGLLGAVWYWTEARNMNAYADRRDIRGATKAVNGGYNNLSGRTNRWEKCLSLGAALLPAPTSVPNPKELDVDEKTLRAIVAEETEKAVAEITQRQGVNVLHMIDNFGVQRRIESFFGRVKLTGYKRFAKGEK